MRQSLMVIEIRELHKSYAKTPAIRGLDLTVQSGEMYGLIGPDGAGKTTLIRILCGLILADSGFVQVLGYDPAAEISRIKDQLGYYAAAFLALSRFDRRREPALLCRHLRSRQIRARTAQQAFARV
ncbi:MAG: ATP-binding cassette domain-containing protein [bacterium]